MADDKYGIEQLADRHDFIDITKVGIYGHSGGGFMSTAALCTYPDFYTAAVSSADELKKYKDLLDSGAITQEEFDAKKKQLLGL